MSYARAMALQRRWFTISATVIALDQASKAWVHATLRETVQFSRGKVVSHNTDHLNRMEEGCGVRKESCRSTQGVGRASEWSFDRVQGDASHNQ